MNKNYIIKILKAEKTRKNGIIHVTNQKNFMLLKKINNQNAKMNID